MSSVGVFSLRLWIAAAAISLLAASPAFSQINPLPEGARDHRSKISRKKPARAKVARRKRVPTPSPRRKAPAVADATTMTVYIVRSAEAGCEPTCARWIAAQGRIDETTPARFRKVLKQVGDERLPVLVDSIGGSVEAGIAIGRLIRKKGLMVAVAKTELTPCAPQDEACIKTRRGTERLGEPSSMLSKCASSCVFVLAGGVRRIISPRSYIGVHKFTSTQAQVLRTYRVERRQAGWGKRVKKRRVLLSEKVISRRTVPTPVKDRIYVKTGKYFREMGVGMQIMTLLLTASNKSIRWLTLSELTTAGLVTGMAGAGNSIMGETVPVLPLPPLSPVGDVPGPAERALDPAMLNAAGGPPPHDLTEPGASGPPVR